MRELKEARETGGQAQEAATTTAQDAVVAFGKNPGTNWSHAAAVSKKLLEVAGAGTMATFGVGRNGGIQLMALAMSRIQIGSDDHPGSPSQLQGVALATAAAAWVGGTALGAIGNFAGAKFLAPVLNAMPQHQRIDAELLVPQAVVDQMNELDPGTGTALRESVEQAQSRASVINSPAAVRAGEWAFSGLTMLGSALPPTTSSLAERFGFNAVASAVAGTIVGAAVSISMATAKIEVPDRAALAAVCDPANIGTMSPAEKKQALQGVERHRLPLFFPDGKAKGDGIRDNIGKGLPGAGGSLKSLMTRGWELAKATKVMGAAQVAAALIPGDAVAARLGRGVISGAAIHTAIAPWFNALAVSIPERDRKLAEEAAPARAAAQPTDVEMGHVAQQPGRA